MKHPATAFLGGLVVAVGGIGVILASCAGPNRSAAEVEAYKEELKRVKGFTVGPEVIQKFGEFLAGIGSSEFVKANTSKVYSEDAFLDDTLVTHRGRPEIEAYFLETSETMTSYRVTIDDVFTSGTDYYFRWTMVFTAPALSDGQPIHSVGVSQVRFNSEGKVAFHQDFWDSGKNLFGHAPVAGSVINFIRKRLDH